MTPGGDGAGRIRTALMTGGTGGMGRVIAAKLAADGFDVAVAYAGSIDLADATVGEIKEHGRHGAAFAADIADADAVSTLFDAVEDRFGHLDVVVHTAGINRPAALTDLDLADFDEIHRVNVRGTSSPEPILLAQIMQLQAGSQLGNLIGPTSKGDSVTA